MDTIDWLCSNAPGFDELPEEDRDAIFHFLLLWSFFEAEALDTRGSANAICALVKEWASQGKLNPTIFQDDLTYFRTRYFLNGTPTEHFPGLMLRENDKPALVHSVLKGDNTSPTDAVAALLIVIFRLRNNLFHGVKWAIGIHGQRANFDYANISLMKALEIQSR
jgi:hypothetical protein